MCSKYVQGVKTILHLRIYIRGRLDRIISEEFISDSMPNMFGCHGIGMSFQMEFQTMPYYVKSIPVPNPVISLEFISFLPNEMTGAK